MTSSSSSRFTPYCRARAPYKGLLEFGCGTFGGLTFNENGSLIPMENAGHYFQQFLNSDNTKSIVPRHFRPSDFALTVRDLEKCPPDLNILPDRMFVETPKNRRRNMNLLTATANYCKNAQNPDDCYDFEIWACDPGTKRKRMVGRRLRAENHQDEKDILTLLDSDPMQCSFEMDSGCLEVEFWPRGSSEALIIRTEDNITHVSDYFGAPSVEKSVIFKDKTELMRFSPNLKLEMAVVDQNGFIFWGEVGESLSRRKLNDFGNDTKINDVCFSDHPRLLYLAEGKNVWTLDLRVPQSNAKRKIFELPNYDQYPNEAFFYLTTYFEEAYVRRIQTIFDSPRHLLVVTDKENILIDERLPNVSLLQVGQSLAQGPDILASPEPFQHSIGKIYPIFAFNQEALNETFIWPLLRYHDKMGQFSSVMSPWRLPSPSCAFSHAIFHSADFPLNKKAIDRANYPTRGLNTVKMSEDSLVLFRLLANGDIWYDYFGLGMKLDDSELLGSVTRNAKVAEKFQSSQEIDWCFPEFEGNIEVGNASTALEVQFEALNLEESGENANNIARNDPENSGSSENVTKMTSQAKIADGAMKNDPILTDNIIEPFDHDSVPENNLLSQIVSKLWK